MNELIEITDDLSSSWNKFVLNNNDSTFSHLYEWKKILNESYLLNSQYYGIIKDSELTAIIPLSIVKIPFFKSEAYSLPFLGSAGIIKNDKCDSYGLNNSLFQLLDNLKVNTIENRRLDRTSIKSDIDYYTPILSLSDDSSLLWDKLDSKVRNQVRKAQKLGLNVTWGVDQIDQFYKIYSKNMYDLGSPVHSKMFFQKIIMHLKRNVNILCIRINSKVIASMILFTFRNTISNPWASSDREYLSYCPNMLMYWEAVRFGCENGFTEFDFGRSHANSGTYKFKLQWGAKPIPLFYDIFSREKDLTKPGILKYRSKKAELFSTLWKAIPYKLTLWLGPKIRKMIP